MQYSQAEEHLCHCLAICRTGVHLVIGSCSTYYYFVNEYVILVPYIIIISFTVSDVVNVLLC